MGEDEISILGPGQLFGEGRFLKIYERMQKEQEKTGVAAAPIRVDKKKDKQLPFEFEDDATSRAPYSVRCLSMEGTVYRINGVDFFKYVLKEK